MSAKDLRTKVTRPFKRWRMTRTAVVMVTIQFRFSDNTCFEILEPYPSRYKKILVKAYTDIVYSIVNEIY